MPPIDNKIEISEITNKEQWEEALRSFKLENNFFLNSNVHEALKKCGVLTRKFIATNNNLLYALGACTLETIRIKTIKDRKIPIIKISCGSREGIGFHHHNLNINQAKNILETIITLIKNDLPKTIPIYTSIVFAATSPQILEGSKRYHHKKIHTATLDLSSPLATIEANLDKKRRNGIRKGRKNGITSSIQNNNEGLDFYYDLKSTQYWNGKETSIWQNRTKEEFFAFHTSLIRSNNLNLFIAKSKNQPAAFASTWCTNSTIYYKEGGLNKAFQEHRPLDTLLMDLIEWGKNNGFATLDFCGANLNPDGTPDSRTKFKLEYGAKITDFHLYQQIQAPIFRINIPVFIMRRLF